MNLVNKMLNKNNNKIAQITLKILKIKSWKNLSLEEVKKKSKIKNFDKLIKHKKDLLKKINQYFDYKLSLESSKIEKSNNKDMIFEVIMMRFDILQIYRKEIKSVFNSFKKKPQDLVFFLPNLLDSIVFMLGLTEISTKGLRGKLKIKGIFIVYLMGFLVWIKDETSSLEKTMTSIDSSLDQAGKIIKFLS